MLQLAMKSKLRVIAACALVQCLALLLAFMATPAAAETCWTGHQGQYFNSIQYCVSSVLSPQAGNTYGPEHLSGSDAGTAWCEGAKGPGIGETITILIEGGPDFRRLLIGNGYNKSPEAYGNNGRAKALEITTDTGIRMRAELADSNEVASIDLPGPGRGWVRVTILDVYPGAKFADTCLSLFTPDFEHEDALEPATPETEAPPTVLQPAQ